MPASTFTTFKSLSLELGKGTHNFTSNTLKYVLSNTAPVAASNAVLADITQKEGGMTFFPGDTIRIAIAVTEGFLGLRVETRGR